MPFLLNGRSWRRRSRCAAFFSELPFYRVEYRRPFRVGQFRIIHNVPDK